MEEFGTSRYSSGNICRIDVVLPPAHYKHGGGIARRASRYAAPGQRPAARRNKHTFRTSAPGLSERKPPPSLVRAKPPPCRHTAAAVRPWRPKWLSEGRPKSILKFALKFGVILDAFGIRFGGQNPSKMLQKSFPKHNLVVGQICHIFLLKF